MALGIAEGVAALHAADPPILHRDLTGDTAQYRMGGGKRRLCNVGLDAEGFTKDYLRRMMCVYGSR